jgi:hypothetical protein
MGEPILSLPEVDPEKDKEVFLAKRHLEFGRFSRMLMFISLSRPAVEPTKPLGTRDSFLIGGVGGERIKQPGYEADSSPLILRLGMRGYIPPLYDASLWVL